MDGQQQKSLAQQIALDRFGKQDLNKQKQFEIPTLQSLALEVVAQNFEEYPDLKGLNFQFIQDVINKTDTNLPVEKTAPFINLESYWKKACETRWKGKTINLEQHGKSWQVAYLEKHIEELVFSVQTLQQSVQKENLQKDFKVCAPWIHTLNILLSNSALDLNFLLINLPLINELSVTYGIKNVGMQYIRNSLGMKLTEAANLGEGIKNAMNLLTLHLQGNQIDDDLLRFIMAGINMNISLIELDLSHNRIGDQGARRLSKFLLRNEILLFLDISNNFIGYDGSRYISQALKVNTNLRSLSLRLNNFNDKAGMKFFQDLVVNRTLTDLNISGNQFSYQTAVQLCEYLSDPGCSLKNLNIANNNFSDDSFEQLKQGFTKNVSLNTLDISGSQFKRHQDKLKNISHPNQLTESEKELTDIIIQHYETTQKLPHFDYDDYQKAQQAEEAKKLEDQAQKQAELKQVAASN